MHRCASTVLLAGLAFSTTLASAQIQRKVMIIGIDGMRPDSMLNASTPNIDGLIAEGGFTTTSLVQDRTVSGPCWSSMLTAVDRDKHGVGDNSFNGSNYDDYPHFFKRLEDICDIETVSIVNWSPINTRIVDGNADTIISGLSDVNVASEMANALATTDVDVAFLQFDEVDGAGHANGFGPDIAPYLAKIEQTDVLVGQVLAAIEARPTYASEDWLIILTTDHGGTPDGTHGRNIPEHRLTPFIVSGRAVPNGLDLGNDVEVTDLPATAVAFLGLPIDPAWDWDGEPQGIDLSLTNSDPFGCVPPPTGGCCLPDGSCIDTTEGGCFSLGGEWAGADVLCDASPCPEVLVLLEEDFESIALGPNVDESVPGANVWSPTPPPNWNVENSGVPAGGVTEWRGWSFADVDWWTNAAADQQRSGFGRADGAVAVADPDEWDDLGHDPGTYNTTLTSPDIPLAGIQAFSARLFFDSSWRPEDDQKVSLTVEFDDGTSQELLRYTSDPADPNYKPDAVNEALSFAIANPESADSFRLVFEMFDAGNDWWWAVDNITVVADPSDGRKTLLSESFDSVTLGPNVDESLAEPSAWTDTPPTGWGVDDSGVPSVGTPGVGVTEWEGWSFADPDWWSSTAGDQNRSLFDLADGPIAVADPDEWDDLGAASALGPYNALLNSPEVSISGIRRGSLELAFDSSWRPDGNQRAEIRAVFDDGSEAVILDWRSSGPGFKPDAVNERVAIAFDHGNAQSVRFAFGLLDAGNNWWWAIDDVQLTGACAADVNQDGEVDPTDFGAWLAAFNAGDPLADQNGDAQVTPTDFGAWLANFNADCP